jgi:RNA polymerase sigma factor (sigma-70 family)
LKDADPAELELAIKAARQGNTYLSPPVSRQVSEYIQRTGGKDSSLEKLTPRQREVLQLIAEGQTNREIAHTLGISVKTVETHRMKLMKRLDIHDIAGLVRYAIRKGLVSLER